MDKYPGLRAKGKGIEIRYSENGTPRSKFYNRPWNPTNCAAASRIRRQILDEIRSGIDHTSHLRSDNPLFQEVAQDYMKHARRHLSTEYCDKIKRDINSIWLPHLGLLPIKSIRTRHCREADESREWSSAKRQQNARSHLRAVFEFAIEDDLIDTNPAAKLKKVIHQDPDIDPFDLEEKEAILSALEGESRFWYLMAFETGLRPSEQLGLRREDRRGNCLNIERAMRNGELQPFTKTRRSRSVIMSSALVEAWDSAVLPIKGPIWLDEDAPITTTKRYWRAWVNALSASEVRYRRPYNCRHTRASIGLSAGQKPGWLAKQLGHDLKTFFDRYARYMESDTDTAEMAKLENHEHGINVGMGGAQQDEGKGK